MECLSTGRLFSCALCFRQVTICSGCDRGNLYCSSSCSRRARTKRQREAGLRYQKTPQGRRFHAARQARYRIRLKEKVTHQGSPGLAADDVLARPPEGGMEPTGKGVICCYICQTHLLPALRSGFLRPRGREYSLRGPVFPSGP